jgi:hypothetical protein
MMLLAKNHHFPQRHFNQMPTPAFGASLMPNFLETGRGGQVEDQVRFNSHASDVLNPIMIPLFLLIKTVPTAPPLAILGGGYHPVDFMLSRMKMAKVRVSFGLLPHDEETHFPL